MTLPSRITKTQHVYTKAPTRIDLVGGTLDIWPLAHILNCVSNYSHSSFSTINLALNLYTYATVRIDTYETYESSLTLLDKQTGSLYQGALSQFPNMREFTLVQSCLFALYKDLVCQKNTHLSISTNTQIPRGSGLGGSSSQIIALLGALNSLMGEPRPLESIIECAVNIESGILNALAGYQDHYAAAYGGIQRISHNVYGTLSSQIKWPNGDFMDFVVMVHACEEHFSAAPNMDVVYKVFSNNKETIDLLLNISQLSYEISNVIPKGNIIEISKIINEEWNLRKRLSHEIESKKISKFINESIKLGALSGKICGAGGGGVGIIILPDPSLRKTVENMLIDQGGQILKANTDYKGLQISEESFGF